MKNIFVATFMLLLFFEKSETLISKSIIKSWTSKALNEETTVRPIVSPDVCSTQICFDESSKVLSKLDPSIDP